MSTHFTPVRSLVHLIERWRFRLLLGLLTGVLFLEPLLSGRRGGEIVMTGLFGIILFGAVLVSEPPRKARYPPYALIAVWLALGWLTNLPVTSTLQAPLLLITMVIGVTVFGFTLRALIVNPEADIDALAGAVFGYLLLAVLWALFYMQLEIWTPGSFGFSDGGDDHSGELLYFSLVTITTLGYGDITALNPFARICTGIEAAQGTLYLAILVGRAVGLLHNQHK